MQATAPSPRTLRLPSRLLRAAPDERLVAALRRGDEKAFEEIYDRHHRALLGFCRHMLGSREEAEDALQHVFVSAHRHLGQGSADVNLKPWLYTIARNRCLSMLRARRETVALDDVHEPSSDGLALADEVELGEDVKEMLGDIARLPVNQRAALVLAELGDLSQREIATTLDVRPDKVKALIFQAREALAGWRQARAASCREIREELATAEGSALRRAPIRRHLALCPACTAFESEVKRQRAAFSLLLPVLPGVALKHSVLTAALSGGHGAVAAGAGGAVAAGAAASGRARARRGSPSRHWWWRRWQSVQAAAARSPFASSIDPAPSCARRRRRPRARTWPSPLPGRSLWSARRPAIAVSGPPLPRPPRAARRRMQGTAAAGGRGDAAPQSTPTS